MVIRAVVFDIGGVLEITPDLGIDRMWETRLGLPSGEILERTRDVWRGGSIGTITLDDVHEALRDRLGLDDQTLAQAEAIGDGLMHLVQGDRAEGAAQPDVAQTFGHLPHRQPEPGLPPVVDAEVRGDL